jgi:serine/threonine protein phosphatase PrpC
VLTEPSKPIETHLDQSKSNDWNDECVKVSTGLSQVVVEWLWIKAKSVLSALKKCDRLETSVVISTLSHRAPLQWNLPSAHRTLSHSPQSHSNHLLSTRMAILQQPPKRRRRRLRPKHPATNRHAVVCLGVASVVLCLCLLWMYLFLRTMVSTTTVTSVTSSTVTTTSAQLSMPSFPKDINDPTLFDALATTANAKTIIQPLMFTWQSNQHDFNQDRAAFYHSFVTRQSASSSDPSFLVAIFDGHGDNGHLMADYVVQHFAPALQARLDSQPCCQPDPWIAAQFNATFWQIELDAPDEASFAGGCTASVTLRVGDKLYLANAGDSRTVLVQATAPTIASMDDDAITIVYETRRDKPHLPDEYERITKAGGRVHIPPPPKSPTGARVILYSAHAHDSIGLAMSRSLGDREWTAVGVVPTPTVDVIDLRPYRSSSSSKPLYLIAASDGLWDLRAHIHYFCKKIGAILLDHAATMDNASTGDAVARMVDVVREVAPQQEKWYRDDITAIAIRIY